MAIKEETKEILETLKIAKDLILQDTYFKITKNNKEQERKFSIEKNTHGFVYMKGLVTHNNVLIDFFISFSVYNKDVLLKLNLYKFSTSKPDIIYNGDDDSITYQNYIRNLDIQKILSNKEDFFKEIIFKEIKTQISIFEEKSANKYKK